MKHSEYNELTRRLSFYSREADRTRELMADPGGIVIWRSVNEADTDLSRWMDERADGWIESNQERADKRLETPTADFRALYDAMVGFMSATEKPDPRGVLYEKTRNRCRSWIDQAVTWFPALTDTNPTRKKTGQRGRKEQEIEQFKADLQSNPKYLEAVEKEKIIRPFIWTQGKRDLVDWLLNNVLPTKTDRNGFRHPRWSVADNVFIINGEPVSGTVLNDTYQHMKGLIE